MWYKEKIEERNPQNIRIFNLTVYMKILTDTGHLQGLLELISF